MDPNHHKMITNEELDWATDLPLTEAWKVVQEYNRICRQLRTWPTVELVMARKSLESKHPGICWLIDYKTSHPVTEEIPVSQPDTYDYASAEVRSRVIHRFLTQLKGYPLSMSAEVRKPSL